MTRGERGQSTLEYLFLVLLLAMVATAALVVLCGGPSELVDRARQIYQSLLR